MIGKNISRYRVLGQVGEGGMGVVYVAEDTVLGRRVAVKIPHAGRNESHYRARFLREARAVSKLRHPNIAAVHDFGETEEGQPFIVMELVSGQTLGELLSGTGISVARSVEVTGEVARALSEAHRLGVVHRDVKPSNVVIDDSGVVKVLDFGLAKQLHEEVSNGGPEAQTLLTARTRSDVVIGTPLYLSPEQARGAKVDGRSDLFALGALLYECLTGRPAFSGSNVIEIGAQVLHFDPPPPSKLNPRVPAELDRLTLKALSKKPEDRFQTAEEFAAELARVRARLPDSDTVTTRRLAGADNGHRSSALITMAEGLRRPKFSPLTLLASLAGLGLLIWAVWYLRQPSAHEPAPEVAALYQQGVAAMREASYYKASGLLAQAVEKDDKYALAHAHLAESLMEMDFLDRAQGAMLNVSTLVPDFSVYPREDALYLEAIRLSVGRKYTDAIRSYEEIVELDPTSPQAHLDLGRAYERNNMSKEALVHYTKATSFDNSYAAAFLRLGTLHARQLNQPGATKAFDSAQKLYADSGNREGEAAVRYQRGRFLLNLSKAAEASAEFIQALALARASNNKYQQVQTLVQLAWATIDGAEAEKTARQAIEIAQGEGMNDQLANGLVMLGNIHYRKLNDRAEAERDYNLALQIARNYKIKRYEAMVYFNLASLREQDRKFDEADELAARGRDFFLDGGYQREADQFTMIAARSKKGRGDYEGALNMFRELLRSADQSGDTGQLGIVHREFGSVLFLQGKYPEALEHFRDSANCATTIGSANLRSHSLYSQANILWMLGHYEEAGALFGQLTGADPQTLEVTKDFFAYIRNAEAEMEISRRNYPEAVAKAELALATLKELSGPAEGLRALITDNLGLAQAMGGERARGRALCEEAVRIASGRDDASILAFAHFALAQVLLEAGDAAGARTAALRAHESFVRAGRPDFEWRALAVAGKASRRLGDEDAAREYMSRADTSLTQFEQRLGAEAAGYRSRPDVQWLRGEFSASTASAAHRLRPNNLNP